MYPVAVASASACAARCISHSGLCSVRRCPAPGRLAYSFIDISLAWPARCRAEGAAPRRAAFCQKHNSASRLGTNYRHESRTRLERERVAMRVASSVETPDPAACRNRRTQAQRDLSNIETQVLMILAMNLMDGRPSELLAAATYGTWDSERVSASMHHERRGHSMQSTLSSLRVLAAAMMPENRPLRASF